MKYRPAALAHSISQEDAALPYRSLPAFVMEKKFVSRVRANPHGLVDPLVILF